MRRRPLQRRCAYIVLALLGAISATSCAEAGDASTQVSDTQTERKTRLAVIGDFGSATDDEYRVARSIRRWTRRKRVGGLVTTGDNIYDSGHPDEFEAAWHQPYGWVDSKGLTKVAALGNHDVVTDEGRHVMDLLDMPARWYRKSFHAVDVLVLDSTRPYKKRQRRWLKENLKESGRAWQVVAFHHPPYSCGGHGYDAAARASFVRILSDHGADLVLNGHEHSYQRFGPRKGVTYVVTGGGGAPLYDLSPCPDGHPERAVGDDDSHHFVKLVVSRDRLLIRAVRPSGTTIDRHALRN